jgi:hypothetical protein
VLSVLYLALALREWTCWVVYPVLLKEALPVGLKVVGEAEENVFWFWF